MLAVQDGLRGSIGYSKRAFSANMTSSEFVVLPAFKRPFHDREGVGRGRLNNLQSLEWLGRVLIRRNGPSWASSDQTIYRDLNPRLSFRWTIRLTFASSTLQALS